MIQQLFFGCNGTEGLCGMLFLWGTSVCTELGADLCLWTQKIRALRVSVSDSVSSGVTWTLQTVWSQDYNFVILNTYASLYSKFKSVFGILKHYPLYNISLYNIRLMPFFRFSAWERERQSGRDNVFVTLGCQTELDFSPFTQLTLTSMTYCITGVEPQWFLLFQHFMLLQNSTRSFQLPPLKERSVIYTVLYRIQYTHGQFSVANWPNPHVFELCEETRTYQETPHRHRENKQTPHRKIPVNHEVWT